jgi:hypothetical protein
VLARSYPLTINVVSITDEPGRTLMQAHRAPMSPPVLLDGRTSAPGASPCASSKSDWPRPRAVQAMGDLLTTGSVLAAFLAGGVALFAPCRIVFLAPSYLAGAREERHPRPR